MSWLKNFGLQLTKRLEIILRRHDIQHNDTQHYDTQHNYTQHSDIQHNNILKMILSMTMLLCFNAVRVLLC